MFPIKDLIFQPGKCFFPRQSEDKDHPTRFTILSHLIVECCVLHAEKAAFGAYRSYCASDHGNTRGPFEYFTYRQLGEDIAALSRALVSLGLSKGDRIGIWSYNRYEWHVLDYVSNCLGIILVPIYDTQNLESVIYITRDSDIKMMFLSLELLPKFNSLGDSWPDTLTNVIVFDNRPDDRAFLLKHASHLTAPYLLHVPFSEEEINERNRDLGCFAPPDKSFYSSLEGVKLPPSPSSTTKLRNRGWSYVPFSHILPTLPLSEREGEELCRNVNFGFCQLIAKGHSLLIEDILRNREPKKTEIIQTDVLFDDSFSHVSESEKVTTTTISKPIPSKISDDSTITHTLADIHPVTLEEHAHLNLPPILDSICPDDIFSIVYSSGTTGDPKGCVLTNENLLCAVYQFNPVIPECEKERIQNEQSEKHRSLMMADKPMTVQNIILGIKKYHEITDKMKWKRWNISQTCNLSYLPNSHIFQRAVSMVFFSRGGCISFFSGSTKTLMDDIFYCRPTVFIVVPRVLIKIFNSVTKKLKDKPAILRFLFHRALNQNIKWKYEAKRLKIPSRYNFVFKDIQRLLGNRCKEIISGSAPLSPSVAEFVGCVMGCELVEGWGMTETCAAGIVQKCPCRSYANCGRPLGSISVKLVDIPELEYLSTDKPYPRGELCIKGGNIFSGYWKLPDKTKEVFDDEGYFHTGDIARFTDGVIQIIDRKKCVYKLSQGEFVSAEALERAYSSSPMVELSFMYGNRYESFVLAVVQVDEAEVRENKTKEVFDDEGYFHTGDIARFTDGVIQIIDRKKCVYKLSQGEFVSAEALERAYSSSPMVELSFMYGNRYESFVLAVVQVDEAEVRESLVSEEIMTKEEVDALEDKEALCHCKKVIGFVHKNIVMCCKEAKLRTFEIPRAVILEWEEWTVDNNCVTPSMKIRRPFLWDKYEPLLTEILTRIKIDDTPGEFLNPSAAAETVFQSLISKSI
ncbi:Long chain fatty acid CoA ligase 5 [Aduncisulcus paluster]|uniref:Long chain fatty acid CoA ligase 5 n=1 Tax=Aduncisulcus paluster TaxID=2918883 RepID=A0ABQ5KYM5_9EUKA|nr:Long chain fatty acid CoA ligase 5 [Aduncisulcus paluster]